MTKVSLTYNLRNTSSTRRLSPSVSNSHNETSRHTLDQMEEQRSNRPKVAIDEPQAPEMEHPNLHPATVIGTTGNYEDVSRPPQHVTSCLPPRQDTYSDSRRPESLSFKDHHTPGHDTIDSSSFTSDDRDRTHTPLEYLPTDSAYSSSFSASPGGRFTSLTSRKQSDSGSTNFLRRPLYHGMLIFNCISLW